MKKILLLLTACLSFLITYSQVIFSENFSNIPIGNKPPGWEISSNTRSYDYARPYDCFADTGFQTPAVGHQAPTRLILPVLKQDIANPVISIRFKVFVFDANMNCGSAKDFPCPTYVRVMLISKQSCGQYPATA